MLSLQNYGSSSETDSDPESTDKTKVEASHLEPLAAAITISSKILAIQAAPDVVPTVIIKI